MIRVFAGFDEREKDGWRVFEDSLHYRCPVPIQLTRVSKYMFPGLQNLGTNQFGTLRFLIPYLCSWTGTAIWLDGSDMLVRHNVAELASHWMPGAVAVVKHDYRTSQKRKYIGTSMESENQDYPRKNWSSVMRINCWHFGWKKITPDTIGRYQPAFLHQFAFLEENNVESLDPSWNHLVGEQRPNADAKIVHYTLGIPSFEHYKDSEHADEWRSYQ